MPFFSIVIPVYNVSDFVVQALNSLKDQTFRDFEAVIVNDGSTDDSREKICNFLKRNHDQRFKLIDIQNSGLGTARNVGVRQIRGEYLLYLDSDDYFDTELLQNLFGKIQSSKETPDVVVFDIQNFDSRTGKLTDSYIFDEKLKRYSDVAWNKAYRVKFYLEHDFQYPAIKFEDTPITHVIMALSNYACKLNFKGYYYRRNRAGSITSVKKLGEFELRAKSLLEFNSNLNRYRVQLADSGKKVFVESKLIKAIIYLKLDNRRLNAAGKVEEELSNVFVQLHPIRNAILIHSIKEFIGSCFVLLQYHRSGQNRR